MTENPKKKNSNLKGKARAKYPGLVLTRTPYPNHDSVIVEGILKIQVIKVTGKQVKLKFVDLTSHKCIVSREEHLNAMGTKGKNKNGKPGR